MSIYSPAGRRRVVSRFKNRQGLLILGLVSLAMIVMLWLMLSGYVRIDVDWDLLHFAIAPSRHRSLVLFQL